MLRSLIAITLGLATSGLAMAGESGGGHVGGGGGWTCREYDGTLRWVRTLDLDEGRRSYVGYQYLPMGDEPEYASRTVEQWLEIAEHNLFEASPGFYSKYLFWKNHVTSVQRPVAGSKFTSTQDFDVQTAPLAKDHCKGGVIPEQPEQLAIFNDELGTLEINEELWGSDLLLPMERAALLMHETIYFMMRHLAHHTRSSLTRLKVAHLFSTKSVSSYAEMFAMSTLTPAGEWAPRVASYKPVAERGFDFASVIIDSFDKRSGVLKLHQFDTDKNKRMASSNWLCQKTKDDYTCTMTWTSKTWTRWRRMHKHKLIVKDSGTLIWLNTRRSGVTWVTTYLRHTDGKVYDFSEKKR
jgi:hypothetical protein